MKSTLMALAFVAAAALSCSDNKSGTSANDLGVRQCHWPSNLDDAGPDQCHAARALVACHDATGATCVCLSDSTDSCASCGVGFSGCQDECGANEYAVNCGVVGPSPNGIPDPPAGCTQKSVTPAGTAQYCCPCQ
jgi:hypothetical protein